MKRDEMVWMRQPLPVNLVLNPVNPCAETMNTAGRVEWNSMADVMRRALISFRASTLTGQNSWNVAKFRLVSR